MKLYLLMSVVALILFSGCTQTGEIIDRDVPDEEPGESGVVGEAESPAEEDPCLNAVCGEIMTTCPDGNTSICTNPCDPETGKCLPCTPDCTGHMGLEKPAGCNLYCDPARCEILDQTDCKCNIALFCDGNMICEQGEYPGSADCPVCDDGDACTSDYYNYELVSCVYETMSPCCGNLECEDSEDEDSCPGDCLEEQEGDVRITALDEVDEWVEFEGYNVIMGGWNLSDEGEKHNYTFPEWFMINGKARLHKGYGEDNETTLFWQKDYYVWNNDGDTATLRDNSGEIVDTYSY